MSNISIVTAFFDIGRSDWGQDVIKHGGPLPHYLKRSTDQYIHHFSRLCELNNEIVVFTSFDLVDTLTNIKKINPKANTPKVISYDYFSNHSNLRNKIEQIQSSSEFAKKINPYQIRNPEYWNKDYVAVTSLKAHFVDQAITLGHINNEWSAWVDFGYCRDDNHLPESKNWNFDFTPNKINFFNYRDPNLKSPMDSISLAVQNNVVFIIGGVFAAQRDNWKTLSNYMRDSLEELMQNGLVDDDQGLLLMSFYKNPELFEFRKMPLDGDIEEVRSIFRKYNNDK